MNSCHRDLQQIRKQPNIYSFGCYFFTDKKAKTNESNVVGDIALVGYFCTSFSKWRTVGVKLAKKYDSRSRRDGLLPAT